MLQNRSPKHKTLGNRNPKLEIRPSRRKWQVTPFLLAVAFLTWPQEGTTQGDRRLLGPAGVCTPRQQRRDRSRRQILTPALNLAAPAQATAASRGQDTAAVTDRRDNVPLGFSPQSYVAERRWERRYLEIPDAARCGKYLRQLTARPHVAGTPGDWRVTEMIYNTFKHDGLNPEIVEYRVLLSYPKKVAVELIAPGKGTAADQAALPPRAFERRADSRGAKRQLGEPGVVIPLANPEPAIPQDKDTRVRDPLVKMPWNGYSPSADLTAPVVYANYGNAEDYEQLEKLGVSVKGKIVLARYFHGYRGGKSLEAEKRGVAGVIVYSDPADDGAPRGAVYPQGPWGPLGHFQRGTVVYDFQTPGDPLTPGWASTSTARRIPQSEARILPKIPMVPLSATDAQEILKRLGGPAVPKEWQGGLPFAYHTGDEAVKVHLALQMENRVTPIWDVIGRIRGSEAPEKLVILSNHHDAWVYGAVDPASGTATMLEVARALGQLVREGFRPRRTILLGNWDAEEYTLTGSTEWGEQFEEELRKNAVVCLNVDASTSGQDFTVSAVPSLLPAIIEAAQAVRDPATGSTVYERWRTRPSTGNIRSYAVKGATAGPVPFGVLGGGSDFMVFLQHDGVPAADMIFDGPYGVYHSLYDDYAWMEGFGDPGFRYHAAMSRLWGLLSMRFADADLLPFDYSIYATEVGAYLQGLEKIAPADFFSREIQPLIKACREWNAAAAQTTAQLEAWRVGGASVEALGGAGPASRDTPEKAGVNPGLAEINVRLMAQERALLAVEGLPDRSWFRHLIYAPMPSYEAETLPGLREALEAQDLERARVQAARLGQAIERACEVLKPRERSGK